MARVRDDYESLGELGRGGYGRVFAARHRATGQQVAIKCLLERVDPTHQARFMRELQIRLDSPHVVQVLDVRIEEGQAYLILELVPGRTADALLAEGRPVPVADALRIGEGVCHALQVAHGQGVIHRDVKPANIFITPDGQVKLGDFGIAKAENTIDVLTRTGQGLGTLAYVAPEQAMDAKRVEPYADLYSLGATLYHLIGGQPPFSPRSVGEVIVQIVEDPPRPLLELRPDCPQPVAALVERLLAKDPTDRAPSARSVGKRLKKLREKHCR